MKLAQGRIRGYALVLGAGTAWGTLGIFYTSINRRFGLPPQTIVFFRAAVALITLLAASAIGRRQWLRVQMSDLPLFAALGILGIAAFYLVYGFAVHVAGASVAAVLLYTAPIWVTLYAWRFLRERLDAIQVLALCGTCVGAGLVAQLYDPRLVRLNLAGVLLGLASGVLYGCYSILSKYALRRYSPWAVQSLALAFGLPLLALVQPVQEVRRAIASPELLLWLVVMGIGPTLVGGLLYAAGLASLPASVASIVVSWEPAFASLLAFFILGERLMPGQVVGAGLILASIVLLGSRDLPPSGPHAAGPSAPLG